MTYGHIPGIDKPLSRLVQGTVMLREDDEAAGQTLLDAVYAAGGRVFDTAHGYGGGQCERVLGRWIASRGVRDDVVILDKGAHPYDGRQRVTPVDIASDLTDSLERLGVERIDLYVLHRDNPDLPVGPIVEALNEHHRAGRIGPFGGSNWHASRIEAANAYAAAHELQPFTVSSPNFSLAVQIQPPWEGCLSVSGAGGASERAWYRTHDMPIFPWSSLAGGFFSGRFRPDNLGGFTASLDRLCVTSYCSTENFARLDRVEALAERYGATIPQIALAYVLNQPQPIFPLVGCATGDEFAQNVAALDLRLSPNELAWLELTTDEVPAP